jgi:hypothetical protein
MTQAKSITHPMDDDDDMLPEYDFSKMGTPVRGKHAQRIRENGYSTTVHHADGTATTTYVTPEEIALRRSTPVTEALPQNPNKTIEQRGQILRHPE